jgi:hypothetical protein
MQFRTSLAYIDDMEQKNRERAARRRGDNEEEDVARPRSAAPGPTGAAGRPGIRKVSKHIPRLAYLVDGRPCLFRAHVDESGPRGRRERRKRVDQRL